MALRSTAIATTLLAFTTSALAHQSTVPHAHPHDTSALLGSELLIVAMLALGAALLFAARYCLKHLRKAPRKQRTNK